MRIYYDCEFLENGETIRLISIGMIREDGKKYYAIARDEDLMTDVYNHDWLRKNVWPSLPTTIVEGKAVFVGNWPDSNKIKYRSEIAGDIQRFINDTPDPELWAYYSAYDHVVLCQLYGRMIDLPDGIPMYTNDLKSLMASMDNPWVPEQSKGIAGTPEGLHNALADAIWNKETYEYLDRLRKSQENL